MATVILKEELKDEDNVNTLEMEQPLEAMRNVHFMSGPSYKAILKEESKDEENVNILKMEQPLEAMRNVHFMSGPTYKANLKEELKDEENVNILKMEQLLETMINFHFMSGPTYKDINLLKALMKIRKNEVEGIFHLSEMLCPSFRFRATALYDRSQMDTTCSIMPMVRDNFTFKCQNRSLDEQVSEMLEMIEEMPKEWTIVQLTPAYKMRQRVERTKDKAFTNPIFISVFNCGQNEEKPVSICVDVPKDGSGNPIELMQNFKELINKQHAQNYTGSYSAFRQGLNNDMKEITKLLQTRWLKEWRVLLIGKFVDTEVEKDLNAQLNDVLREVGLKERISERAKILLRYIVKGDYYLDLKAIKAAVSLIFDDHDNVTQDELLDLIKALKKEFLPLSFENVKRHPVILVVEESIDCLPWEMMDVIRDHPICRMPSLHFTYALYKEHENEIVDGWKVLKYRKKGACIINPDCDLPKMQNRMRPFFQYWLPGWEKIIARRPSSEEICKLILSAEIFCYNGHGDGFQYIRGDKLQKLRVNAVVLLFGCSSVRLKDTSPQYEPYGSYQNYITACSPCIVGALWNVTDTDTDVLSTEFITTWIPSDSAVHWRNIDKKQWEQGTEEIDIKLLKKNKVIHVNQHEPELLRALCKARSAARQYLTQAACVARGIPVKLVTN